MKLLLSYSLSLFNKKLVAIIYFIMVLSQIAGCAVKPQGWALEASEGNKLKTKSLIENSVELDSLDEHWDTPFLWAARNGFRDLVELLLSRGISVDERNKTTGETALILAVKNGHSGVVDSLMKNNANISIQDNVGKSALDWAVSNNRQQLVQLLTNLSTAPSGSDIKSNPVVSAVYANNYEIVNSLIQSNYPVNAKDTYGETPLVAAAKTGNREIASLLLKNGADVNIGDNESRTPLMWVAQTSNIALAGDLLKSGSRVNAVSELGYSALIFAAIRGQEKTMQFLLENGASFHLTSIKDMNVAYLTALSGNYHMIGALLKAGVDPAETPKDIRESKPSITAPMFDSAGYYSVINNDIPSAVKYYQLAEEDFMKSSEQYADFASDEAMDRLWAIVGKVLLASLASYGSQVEAEMRAKQMAQYSALAHSNSYAQYHQNYSMLKPKFGQLAQIGPANQSQRSRDALNANQSEELRSKMKEINFEKLAKKASDIAFDITQIITCLNSQKKDYTDCIPKE